MDVKIADQTASGGTSLAKVAWSSCRFAILGAVLISMVMNVLVLTGPFYMLQIYDRVLPAHSYPTLIAFSVLALILFIAHGCLDLVRTRLMARLGSVLDMKFAEAAFVRSTRRGPQADVASFMLRDLSVVRQFLSGPAAVGLLDIPWLPFYMGLIFLLHPLIGWVSVGSAVIFLIIAGLNEWMGRKPGQSAEFHSRKEEQFVSDVRANIDTAGGMGMVPDLKRHWSAAHASAVAATQNGSDVNASYAVVSRNLRLIVQSSILGLGAYLTMQMELSSGALIACSIIFARALAPVDQAVAHWRTILAVRRSWKRLGALKLEGASYDRTDLRAPCRSLSLSNIALGSKESRKMIIPNVSLRVEAGDCLGVIGPSGAGKSSLLRALVGSMEPVSGEIRIDGATLDQWNDKARAKHIGYLAQDVQLLDGTIRQNISRFQTDVSSEAVIAAAEMAGVHELILSLPDGYDTVIGANGMMLSAGQKQRVGLARAVYGAPFLVILDEPNAHLDRHGEEALGLVLRKLRAAGSIVVVAAHRSAILSEVNKMLLLENGQPGLFGSKEDVLAQLAANARKQVERGLHVVGA